MGYLPFVVPMKSSTCRRIPIATFEYVWLSVGIWMHLAEILASTSASVGYLRFCSQNLTAGAGQIIRFSLLNTNADGSQQSGWCLAN